MIYRMGWGNSSARGDGKRVGASSAGEGDGSARREGRGIASRGVMESWSHGVVHAEAGLAREAGQRRKGTGEIFRQESSALKRDWRNQQDKGRGRRALRGREGRGVVSHKATKTQRKKGMGRLRRGKWRGR